MKVVIECISKESIGRIDSEMECTRWRKDMQESNAEGCYDVTLNVNTIFKFYAGEDAEIVLDFAATKVFIEAREFYRVVIE